MSANLMAALAELASLKQIKKDNILEAIKQSLEQAVSKKMVPENELEIIADFETNTIKANFYKIVVERDFGLGQISLEDAQKIDKDIELEAKIPVSMNLDEFEPKIISSAKREILKRIKDMEEDKKRSRYETQKNQIISGKVTKVDYTGYIVDIGYTDALLPVDEQVDNEFFKVGDIIRAFVVNIKKRRNDIVVILSRTRAEFVKKIFEMEIPEIAFGDIEIKKIVREPSIRTKVAVRSLKPNIDVKASCLGLKGVRIEHIRKELNNEAVDVVEWDESPEQFIVNAIGVDLVEKVYLADRGKFARIIVSKEKKISAIGRNGKNVKLAAKLTDYKLDIFTEEEFEDKIAEERRITSHVRFLDGVSPKVAEVLKDHGYTSVQDIFSASIEELCNLEGLGKKTAIKIKESAKYF